jgi:hypothetical protein
LDGKRGSALSDVELSGPLFDGSAERAAARAVADIEAKVAQKGADLSATTLANAIRHHGSGKAERSATTTAINRVYQTGKYTMPVMVDRSETVVTTDLATYGPWLEGTGSRNETTRFKGYHSFRLAGQVLDGLAEAIAEEALQPYLKEMQLWPSIKRQ